MVTVKGRNVTFTGKDAELIKFIAKERGITPKQALNEVIKAAITKAEDVLARKNYTHADEMLALSGGKARRKKK